MKQVQQKMDR